MGLFSFFRKNKQSSGSDQRTYHSRAEDGTGGTHATQASRKRKTATNQTNDAVDPVLPEKKRARRRLVGAIALVLAVVIVLPMVLDSEPKPLANDISIQIPTRDNPRAVAASTSASASTSNMARANSGLDQQEEIIDAASTAGSARPSSGQPQNVVGSAASVTSINPMAPVTPSLPSIDNASPSEAVALTAPVTAEVKPEVKIVTKPKVEIKPKVDVKDEQKSRSEPKLEAKIEDRPSISESHNEAARAAAILNGGNPAPTDAKKQNKFVIQVAALASQDKVDELQGKLNDAGIHSYTQKVKTSAGDRIRIRVGPFANKDEAEKARAKLTPLGLSGSLVPS